MLVKQLRGNVIITETMRIFLKKVSDNKFSSALRAYLSDSINEADVLIQNPIIPRHKNSFV